MLRQDFSKADENEKQKNHHPRFYYDNNEFTFTSLSLSVILWK